MRKGGAIARFAAMIVAAASLAAAASAQALSEQQIADRIAKDYGVKVLKMVKGDEDGRPVLFVTVMNDGGNFNDAFQVSTLAVDPATGNLIVQYRSTPSGQQLSGAGSRSPSTDESGAILRQWSTRPSPR